jgi:hypothetical protein
MKDLINRSFQRKSNKIQNGQTGRSWPVGHEGRGRVYIHGVIFFPREWCCLRSLYIYNHIIEKLIHESHG